MEWSLEEITKKQKLVYPIIKDNTVIGLSTGVRDKGHKLFKVHCYSGVYKVAEVLVGVYYPFYIELYPPIKLDSTFKILIELE